MQGQRRAINSLTETVDLNQDLYNDTNIDHSTAWNNVLNPAERRLPHNGRSFSGWDLCESSSTAHLRDPISSDVLLLDCGWSSSYRGGAATEASLEEPRYGPPDILRHDTGSNGLVGNQIAWRNLNAHISRSDLYPANIDLNDSYPENDDEDEESKFPRFYKPGSFVTEPNSSASISSGNGETSDNTRCDDDGSGSSMGNWGSSCKRRTFEVGTSSQPYASGNTSFFLQPENIVPRHSPAHHNTSSSWGISSSTVNYLGVTCSEQLNPRLGVGMRRFVSNVFAPSSVPGTIESSPRNAGARINLGHQEPAPFNFPTAGSTLRHSNARSSNQSSRLTSFSDSLEFGPTALPTDLSNPLNQSHVVHNSGSFLTRSSPFVWNDCPTSRTGSSSSSVTIHGERGTQLHEDAGFRSNIRNNEERPMLVPGSQTPGMIQYPTDWSSGTGGSSIPNGIAPSSQAGPSSSSNTSPTGWLPHQNSVTQNPFGLSEFAPWSLFSSSESESSIQRGLFTPVASRPPSPEESRISSRANSQGHNQPYTRSAYMMNVPGENANGWHSLAANIDGRQRLQFRQVLNAMQRGENMRAEDNRLINPYMNGVAELHDRHRDMRLDVDNMSYEELLALEERIGNVETGLSEEVILQSLKEQQFSAFMKGLLSLEPCCICQEEYMIGETIGTLDCGHDFHSNCVKQWLRQKNICPICKMTGIGT